MVLRWAGIIGAAVRRMNCGRETSCEELYLQAWKMMVAWSKVGILDQKYILLWDVFLGRIVSIIEWRRRDKVRN